MTSNQNYNLYAERLLPYTITTEPTENTDYPSTMQPSSLFSGKSDCSVYVIISATTSMVTTLIVICAVYYLVHLRNKCKTVYLDEVSSLSLSLSSSSSSSSQSSSLSTAYSIDIERGNELFWFEDVYNGDT